jgi:hypothetical protein
MPSAPGDIQTVGRETASVKPDRVAAMRWTAQAGTA